MRLRPHMKIVHVFGALIWIPFAFFLTSSDFYIFEFYVHCAKVSQWDAVSFSDCVVFLVVVFGTGTIPGQFVQQKEIWNKLMTLARPFLVHMGPDWHLIFSCYVSYCSEVPFSRQAQWEREIVIDSCLTTGILCTPSQVYGLFYGGASNDRNFLRGANQWVSILSFAVVAWGGVKGG